MEQLSNLVLECPYCRNQMFSSSSHIEQSRSPRPVIRETDAPMLCGAAAARGANSDGRWGGGGADNHKQTGVTDCLSGVGPNRLCLE